MTFSDKAISRYHGKPVELYTFRYGSGPGDSYNYTMAPFPITVAGVTYAPSAIKHDDFEASGTMDKKSITLTVPRDIDVAELFRVFPPATVVTVIVRQGHIGDPDEEFLVVWSGRVLGGEWKDSEVDLTCEPAYTSLSRPGLRRNYQIGCPLPLYSQGVGLCNANKAAATTATTAEAISGREITVDAGVVTVKHRGGLAEWVRADGVTETRTILKVDAGANKITLAGPARGLVVGGAINVILGCNHILAEDCVVLHNNANNYGGQDRIPLKNPFGNANNFY